MKGFLDLSIGWGREVSYAQAPRRLGAQPSLPKYKIQPECTILKKMKISPRGVSRKCLGPRENVFPGPAVDLDGPGFIDFCDQLIFDKNMGSNKVQGTFFGTQCMRWPLGLRAIIALQRPPFLLFASVCLPFKPIRPRSIRNLRKHCNLPQRGPGEAPATVAFCCTVMLAKLIWMQHFSRFNFTQCN